MPVNNIQDCGWKQDLIGQAFSVFQCNLYYFPSSWRGNVVSCPLEAWLGRGNLRSEMSEDINKPPILPEEREQNLQWGCQCEGTRSQTELRGGLGLGVFVYFPFPIILSKAYSGYPEYQSYPTASSEAFSPNNIYFYTIHSLKKKPWKTKIEFIFPLLQFVQWTEKNQLYAYTQPQVWETPPSTYGADIFP